MVRSGIIGFGKMGQIRAKEISSNGKGAVVSVYEPNENIDSQEFHRAKSAEEIIHDPAIDAVIICTPNFLNKPLTIAALKAGKHVFCEKPPAFNAGEVEEIKEVAEFSDKKLMYGFNHRHHASIQRMKKLIDSQEYGNVLWMRGRYGKSVDKDFFKDWRVKQKSAGGGIFLDQGIHMLDLFLYIGGEFDEVKSFVSNLYWKLDIEDNVFAIFKNSKTGMAASLHSTMTQWRHLFSFEVFLEKGYMVLNGLKTSSGTYGDEVLSIAKNRSTAPAATWKDEERTTYHSDSFWKSEVEHFFTAIISDKPIEIGNINDALKLMQMVDKVYAEGRL
ncbi:MAG: Gfo/Idh/MocA family oxidoreductase [Candidatus Aminicenantes bacterium]|nr:Gfo/Idh/MocA family oxidoreductase [Candidatus Aminicenantes bacterium]